MITKSQPASKRDLMVEDLDRISFELIDIIKEIESIRDAGSERLSAAQEQLVYAAAEVAKGAARLRGLAARLMNGEPVDRLSSCELRSRDRIG